VTPANYQSISELLKSRSGLVLGPDKQYLLESRLVPIVRRRNLAGLDELAAKLKNGADPALVTEVTDAMTTNESFFFRDNTPFDNFRKTTLPALIAARAGRKQIRIWSAAASTGQEPYSLAMILKEEAAKLAGFKIDIIGTDLSQEVLEKAKAGIYSQFEVQRGLPIQFLMKYFAKVNEMWQIDASLRAMVQYRMANLLDPLTWLGTVDVIFCRNVLIYFDQPTKTMILDRMAKILAPDGALFLGGAETVLGISDQFKSIKDLRGVYVRAA
jgi:chemotaxis protein methyltransferase CheR